MEDGAFGFDGLGQTVGEMQSGGGRGGSDRSFAIRVDGLIAIFVCCVAVVLPIALDVWGKGHLALILGESSDGHLRGKRERYPILGVFVLIEDFRLEFAFDSKGRPYRQLPSRTQKAAPAFAAGWRVGSFGPQQQAFDASSGRTLGEDSSRQDAGGIAEDLVGWPDVFDQVLEVAMLQATLVAVDYEQARGVAFPSRLLGNAFLGELVVE